MYMVIKMIIKKWRDLTFDPYKIKFKNFKLLDIISYPHAQNDVIEIEIKMKEENKTKLAFLKYERSKKANLKEEHNILKRLHDNTLYSKIPNIIEYATHNDKDYIVLEKLEGDKLSTIFKNSKQNKEELLLIYGEELAKIHKIKPRKFNLSMKRKINYIPDKYDYNIHDKEVQIYIKYLVRNYFKKRSKTFIHGDFHYGNILFKDNNIAGVLDWEYAGKGLKEQDIAWALILRPDQLFLDNIEDIKLFLEGYNNYNSYKYEKLKWCLINGYLHFYFTNEDKKYKNKILTLLDLIYNDNLK